MSRLLLFLLRHRPPRRRRVLPRMGHATQKWPDWQACAPGPREGGPRAIASAAAGCAFSDGGGAAAARFFVPAHTHSLPPPPPPHRAQVDEDGTQLCLCVGSVYRACAYQGARARGGRPPRGGREQAMGARSHQLTALPNKKTKQNKTHHIDDRPDDPGGTRHGCGPGVCTTLWCARGWRWGVSLRPPAQWGGGGEVGNTTRRLRV